MVNFADSLDNDSTLYLAVNNVRTRLSADISDTDTTIPVLTTSGFPTSGYISILSGSDVTETEAIKYSTFTDSSFTGVERGADGTTAREHSSFDYVAFNVVAAHHNSLKDAVISLEHFVGTSGSPNVVLMDESGNISIPGNAIISGSIDTHADLTVTGTIALGPDPAQSAYASPIYAYNDTEYETTTVGTGWFEPGCETTALENGIDYLVIYSASHGSESTSVGSSVEVLFGSTRIAYTGRTKSGLGTIGNNHYNGGTCNGIWKVTGNGSDTLKFRIFDNDGSSKQFIGAMSILAIPLDRFTENVDYYFDGLNSDTYTLINAPVSPTWGIIRSSAFNSMSAEEYLFLFSVETNADVTAGYYGKVRYTLDNVTIGSEYDLGGATSNNKLYGTVAAHLVDVVPASGSVTVQWEGYGSWPTPNIDFRRPRAFAIKKSLFDQILHTTDTSGFATSSSTYQPYSALDTSISPYTLNNPVVVFTTSNAYTKDNNSQVATALRNDTTGQNYSVDSAIRDNYVGGAGTDCLHPNFTMHYETLSVSTDYRLMVRSEGAGAVRVGRSSADGSGELSEMVVWSLNPAGSFTSINQTTITSDLIQGHQLIADIVDVRDYLHVGSGIKLDATTGISTFSSVDANYISSSHISSTEITSTSGAYTTSLTISGQPANLASPSSDITDVNSISSGSVTVAGGLFIDATTDGNTITLNYTGNPAGFGDGDSLHVWTPDAPPASGTSYDDEWDSGSITGWTTWNVGGNATFSCSAVSKSLVIIHDPPSGAADVSGLFRAAPSNDFTIYTKMFYLNNVSLNYHEFGLVFAEDLTGNPSTANFAVVSVPLHQTSSITDAYFFGLALQHFNNYASFDRNIDFRSIQFPANEPIYLRAQVDVSARTVTVSASRDGLIWGQSITGDFSSDLTTIDEIGYWINAANANEMVISSDFFRVVESIDNTIPLRGNYVTISGIQAPLYTFSEITATSGTFSESVTISGQPVATGTGGGTVGTLQDAYDNGDGTITTTAGKPFIILGDEYDGNVDFKVVGSGIFTEALQVGSGTTFINTDSILTSSINTTNISSTTGEFTTTLTISGQPVPANRYTDAEAIAATEPYRTAVSGNLQDQLYYKNVRNYGALGDGSTDDTLSIQNAIDDLSLYTTIIPSGTYVISGLTIDSASKLIVDKGASLKLKDNTAAHNITVNADDVTICGDGVVDGNRANQVSDSNFGITSSGSHRLLVDGLHITGMPAQGIFVRDGNYCTIRSCRIDNTGQTAIHAYSIIENLEHFKVIDCFIDRSDDPANDGGGIKIQEIDPTNSMVLYPSVINSTVLMHSQPTGSNVVGIEYWGDVRFGKIDTCTVSGAAIGISVANGSSRSVVSSSTVVDADGIGIELVDCASCTAVGNTVEGNNNMTTGLVVDGSGLTASGNAVIGNFVRGATDRNIYIYFNADYVTVAGNTVDVTVSNAKAIQTLESSNFSITGNVLSGNALGNQAIYINNGSFFTVQGNLVRGWKRGIQLVANGEDHDYGDIGENVVYDTTINSVIITEQNGGSYGNHITIGRNPGYTYGSLQLVESLRYSVNGDEIVFRGAHHVSPESSVTAGAGSFLQVYDIANPASLAYLKSTTSGNTGWLPIQVVDYGTTADRPTGLGAAGTGFRYFDTDLGQPIYWNGSGWVTCSGSAA